MSTTPGQFPTAKETLIAQYKTACRVVDDLEKRYGTESAQWHYAKDVEDALLRRLRTLGFDTNRT